VAVRRREDLVDGHPAMAKAVGTTGQVDAPDAVALFAGDATDGFGVGLEALRPVVQGQRVMAAQVFHVCSFQAGGFQFAQCQ